MYVFKRICYDLQLIALWTILWCSWFRRPILLFGQTFIHAAILPVWYHDDGEDLCLCVACLEADRLRKPISLIAVYNALANPTATAGGSFKSRLRSMSNSFTWLAQGAEHDVYNTVGYDSDHKW